MKKLQFAKDFAGFFDNTGLNSFDDFFNYSAGETINRNKKRDVIAITLGDGDEKKELFVKRFFSPHFKDMLFTLQNFGYICSQAKCEWNNANLLLENGIDTYRPVCFGSETVLGIEKKSFFVTEKIQGIVLTDFVSQHWEELSLSQKENIITSLAKLIRKAHDAKISLPDLYLWHIFITNPDIPDGNYNYAIIDLHRMKINTSSTSEHIRNLGAFDFSLSEKYFDEHLRTLLLEAYHSYNYPLKKEVLLRKVKARSQQLTNRRRKPDY